MLKVHCVEVRGASHLPQRRGNVILWFIICPVSFQPVVNVNKALMQLASVCVIKWSLSYSEKLLSVPLKVDTH